jgi:hypothetical protein
MSIVRWMGVGYDIENVNGMFGQSMRPGAVQLQYRSCKQILTNGGVRGKEEEKGQSRGRALGIAPTPGGKMEHATHEETEMSRSTVNKNYTHVTREHQFLAEVRG